MGRSYQGIGVSSGVAVGRALLLHAEPLPVVPEPVPPERVEEEIERFHKARELAARELDELKRQVLQALGEAYVGIFEAQKLVLDDPSLVGETVQRIRLGRVSARWALRETVAEFLRKFDVVEDEYIRERGGELTDVQRRLQRLLRGEPARPQVLPEGPQIVIARNVVASDALLLGRGRIVGLATDAGGRTAHTAILAQALDLPAVVGLHDLSRRVRSGDVVMLDGGTGQVTLIPSRDEVEGAERRRQQRLVRDRQIASTRDVAAVTRDGTEIVIRANIEFPEEIDRALQFGARGIGLYRSEFLFLIGGTGPPSEQNHYQTYVDLAHRVAPHPAAVRTLDLGGEKYVSAALEPREPNPVLGMRGIRFSLRHPEIFRPQLRGVLRAAAEATNLRVLLPVVTSVEEVREVRRLISRESNELRASGHPVREGVELGIMIEVPAAALAADVLAREADFFSIGTNDLIQYALAVDRGNESLDHLYEPSHPGLLRMLRWVVDAARRCGTPVAICGEMAADPRAVGLLVGLGLREFSVYPRAVPKVREAVRGLDSAEAARRAEQALDRPTAEDVGRAFEVGG